MLPAVIAVISFSQFSPCDCWFFFFICLAFPNKPLNTQERVRHVYSYSYVVCWQKQTKELMRFVWINNNFTHSCFIISHSSSAIIRNIASSLSFPFHTWIIMRIIFCVSAISEDFFLLVLHPVSKSKKKLKCASLDDEGSKNQRSRYIYSRRNFPLLL